MSHHKHRHHSHYDEGADSRRRALESKKEKDAGGRFVPPVGKTTFRILQTPGDEERNSDPMFMEVQVHKDLGPKHRSARCGNEPGEGHDPKNCWGCRRMAKLIKKKRTKEAARLNPGKNTIVQVAIEDKDLGEMVGPLLLETNSGKSSKALGYKLLNILSNPKSTKWLDHERGYNFILDRKGTGKDTVWEIERDDEPTAVPREIIKRLKPFADSSLIFKYNEEYMKNAYFGIEPQGEEDNMKENKKKKKKREEDSSDEDSSAVDSSDEEESSDVDASDEDSSDEKPKKKKKKDSSDSSDDDDSSDEKDSSDEDSSDEDEDASDEDSSDEDSSDEKPKKKKKKDSSDEDSSDEDSSDEDSSDEDSSDEDSSDEKPKKKKKKDSSDSSDEDSSDEDSSDEDSSDADSSDEDSSDSSDEKPKKKAKRKPRSDKGKSRKTKKTKKSK